jgi:sugar phosphate isomerase/epimerase
MVDAMNGIFAALPWRLSVYARILPHETPEEAARMVKRTGYSGIEWCVQDLAPALRSGTPSVDGNNRCIVPPSLQSGTLIRELTDRQGLQLVGLAGYTNDGLEKATQLFAMASRCAAPQVRITPPRMRDEQYGKQVDRFIKYLAQLVDLGKQNNTKPVLQPHYQSICPSAELTRRVVSQFDPAHVGVVFDPGNNAKEGFVDYRIGLEVLSGYISHVHLKNVQFRRAAPGRAWEPAWGFLNDGVVDVVKFLRALTASGYRGWISISDFSESLPDEELLLQNRATIAQIMEQIANE